MRLFIHIYIYVYDYVCVNVQKLYVPLMVEPPWVVVGSIKFHWNRCCAALVQSVLIMFF